MKKQIDNLIIELKIGDITRQPDIEAIVNAANAELRIGGGVAGAIHRKGDPELEKETRPLAPISPGQAVITNAPGLPNKYIIHCLGPVYGRDKPSDQLLADCYRNAVKLADKNGISSIAFPAISTGAFGFPMRSAAQVALRTISQQSDQVESSFLVRFVLFDENAFEIHARELETI
ncbi:MAG: macro domain-containing protein [Balneolaceae bacterium]